LATTLKKLTSEDLSSGPGAGRAEWPSRTEVIIQCPGRSRAVCCRPAPASLNLGLEGDYNGRMCYSAKVQQTLRSLAKRFGADIDWPLFEEVFGRRLKDDDIKVARALERNFDRPESALEERIRELIEAYRDRVGKLWETDLFKQKKRLADARRSLQDKETKKARNEERIATSKIAATVERLANLRSREVGEEDERIFPRYFVPIVVREDDRVLIRPMRYQCRLAGKPSTYDERFPGTYNARRDSLQGFWSDVYGSQHGVMVVNSFYENVPQHLFEKRELAPGERPKNLVLHFNPQPPMEMLVACLWSHWTHETEPDLYSFAAVTDEPPPEIAATGHTRCIIAIRPQNVGEWLAPQGLRQARLEEILSDRPRPYYEHRIAA
jgi:putative SOS response-associated peptidase YedK